MFDNINEATIVHFRGCSFIENSSMIDGGGLACAEPANGLFYELTCSYCLFMCNSSTKGGGVWMNQAGSGDFAGDPESTFCTCSFQKNTAVYEGDEDDVVAETCTDCNHDNAIGCGGGLWISGTSWECPNDSQNPNSLSDFYYDCLHFDGNRASYACTNQYRHPGCGDDADDDACNTDEADPDHNDTACSFTGTYDGPSVIDLDCTLNPLSHLLDACPGDINGDGLVDGADLSILLGEWGTNPGCNPDCSDSDSDAPYPLTCGNPSLERMDIDDAPIGGDACCESDPNACEMTLEIDSDWVDRAEGGQCSDLNGNGFVDGADLAVLLGFWGACP